MSDKQSSISRRSALKCMAYGGAGTLFALSGGIFTPIDLAMASEDKIGVKKLGKPLFVRRRDGIERDDRRDVIGSRSRQFSV